MARTYGVFVKKPGRRDYVLATVHPSAKPARSSFASWAPHLPVGSLLKLASWPESYHEVFHRWGDFATHDGPRVTLSQVRRIVRKGFRTLADGEVE